MGRDVGSLRWLKGGDSGVTPAAASIETDGALKPLRSCRAGSGIGRTSTTGEGARIGLLYNDLNDYDG